MDQTLSASVYRKETFSDQYFNYRFECTIPHNVAVVKILEVRVLRYSSNGKLFNSEKKNIFIDLRNKITFKNKYPLL